MPASAVHFLLTRTITLQRSAGERSRRRSPDADITAKRIRIDFDRLWTQRFSDNLPRRIKRADCGPHGPGDLGNVGLNKREGERCRRALFELARVEAA